MVPEIAAIAPANRSVRAPTRRLEALRKRPCRVPARGGGQEASVLGITGARAQVETTWQPCYELTAHLTENALAEHARCIEERLYYSLNGLIEEAAALAEAASAAGLPEGGARGELGAVGGRRRC